MRVCEFCSAAVDDATNKCTGCGAAQSTPAPAPAPPAATTGAVAAPPASVVVNVNTPGEAEGGKAKGSVGCLVLLAIGFWPAAIVYYFMRRWK